MSGRHRYIDWARGLAVLVMIEAHTLDAWTLHADRASVSYRNLMVLGGFAAPLFLFLAGIAVPFAANSALKKNGDRFAAATAVFKRGAFVFLLALLFRLQAFIVTPGSSPWNLLRVDILNIMGPAMMAAALLWGVCRTPVRFAVATAGLTAALAMATPLVRSSVWPSHLPDPVEAYLRPAGTFASFSIFPWAGFLFAGSAVGTLMSSTGKQLQTRLLATIGVVGGVLVAFGFYAATLPSIYAESKFWTSSPTFFAIRLGVMMVAIALLFGLERVAGAWIRPFGPLERLGQSSLFVYWIHVELVYGYASWPLRGRLTLPLSVLAWAAFSALMFGAVVLRDRIAGGWTRRGLRGAGSPIAIS